MALPKMYFSDPTSEFMSFGEWFVKRILPKKMEDPSLHYAKTMLECGLLIEQNYVKEKK